MACAVVFSACDSDAAVDLSVFSEASLVTGRALENVTDCAVDAVCYLRIEFADTTIAAIYGTGERPAPPCPISVLVSDLAFAVARGDVIDVVITDCAGEGMFLEHIVRDP